MHILLLTEDLKRGQFIQQGLRYESMVTDLMFFSDFRSHDPTVFLRYDGVFIHNYDFLILEQTIDFFLHLKNNISLMVLVQNFHSCLNELLNRDKKIQNFFIRPFPFRLMAAEMRFAIFQEREKIKDGVLKVRDLELDREAREIRFRGKTIYLRNKEFALLEFLMLNSGKVLSRGTILEHVWDRNADLFTNTVDVHINQLRKKIDYETREKFIRTIPCTGYVFS